MDRRVNGTLVSASRKQQANIHDADSDATTTRVSQETRLRPASHIPLSDVSLIITPATPICEAVQAPLSLTTKL